MSRDVFDVDAMSSCSDSDDVVCFAPAPSSSSLLQGTTAAAGRVATNDDVIINNKQDSMSLRGRGMDAPSRGVLSENGTSPPTPPPASSPTDTRPPNRKVRARVSGTAKRGRDGDATSFRDRFTSLDVSAGKAVEKAKESLVFLTKSRISLKTKREEVAMVASIAMSQAPGGSPHSDESPVQRAQLHLDAAQQRVRDGMHVLARLKAQADSLTASLDLSVSQLANGRPEQVGASDTARSSKGPIHEPKSAPKERAAESHAAPDDDSHPQKLSSKVKGIAFNLGRHMALLLHALLGEAWAQWARPVPSRHDASSLAAADPPSSVVLSLFRSVEPLVVNADSPFSASLRDDSVFTPLAQSLAPPAGGRTETNRWGHFVLQAAKRAPETENVRCLLVCYPCARACDAPSVVSAAASVLELTQRVLAAAHAGSGHGLPALGRPPMSVHFGQPPASPVMQRGGAPPPVLLPCAGFVDFDWDRYGAVFEFPQGHAPSVSGHLTLHELSPEDVVSAADALLTGLLCLPIEALVSQAVTLEDSVAFATPSQPLLKLDVQRYADLRRVLSFFGCGLVGPGGVVSPANDVASSEAIAAYDADVLQRHTKSAIGCITVAAVDALQSHGTLLSNMISRVVAGREHLFEDDAAVTMVRSVATALRTEAPAIGDVVEDTVRGWEAARDPVSVAPSRTWADPALDALAEDATPLPAVLRTLHGLFTAQLTDAQSAVRHVAHALAGPTAPPRYWEAARQDALRHIAAEVDYRGRAPELKWRRVSDALTEDFDAARSIGGSGPGGVSDAAAGHTKWYLNDMLDETARGVRDAERNRRCVRAPPSIAHDNDPRNGRPHRSIRFEKVSRNENVGLWAQYAADRDSVAAKLRQAAARGPFVSQATPPVARAAPAPPVPQRSGRWTALSSGLTSVFGGRSTARARGQAPPGLSPQSLFPAAGHQTTAYSPGHDAAPASPTTADRSKHTKHRNKDCPLPQSLESFPLDRDQYVHGLSAALELPLRVEANEVFLYHGTSEQSARLIMERGFDPSRSGDSTGQVFGQGTYFTPSLSKAWSYAKESTAMPGARCILIARVVLGHMYDTGTKAHNEWRRPPEIESGPRRGEEHDSVLGDNGQHGAVCVVYRHTRMYPEFLALVKRS